MSRTFENYKKSWNTGDPAKRQACIDFFEKQYPEESAERRAAIRVILERWRATLDRATERLLYQRLCRLLEKISTLPPPEERANESDRLTEAEKPDKRETVVESQRATSLAPKEPKRGSVTPRVEDQDENDSPPFVQREQQRRGPGRPKQPREPIRWQEVEKLWEKANQQQAQVVQQFQVLLDNLTGSAGQSPEENKALAKAINNLAERLGVDLTIDGQRVDVNWYSGAFYARATGTARATQDSSAGFPRLTAQAKSPNKEVDVASWVARTKGGQKARGIGEPKEAKNAGK